MLQKIKRLTLSISTLMLLFLPAAIPSTVLADVANSGNATIPGSTCSGAKNLEITPTDQSISNCTDTASTDNVNRLIKEIINILSVIVGIVAVIMIIIGGFRYITSGGSAEKITSAKNTILYALIGLIIVALAQVIVRFVLGKITSST